MDTLPEIILIAMFKQYITKKTFLKIICLLTSMICIVLSCVSCSSVLEDGQKDTLALLDEQQALAEVYAQEIYEAREHDGKGYPVLVRFADFGELGTYTDSYYDPEEPLSQLFFEEMVCIFSEEGNRILSIYRKQDGQWTFYSGRHRGSPDVPLEPGWMRLSYEHIQNALIENGLTEAKEVQVLYGSHWPNTEFLVYVVTDKNEYLIPMWVDSDRLSLEEGKAYTVKKAINTARHEWFEIHYYCERCDKYGSSGLYVHRHHVWRAVPLVILVAVGVTLIILRRKKKKKALP